MIQIINKKFGKLLVLEKDSEAQVQDLRKAIWYIQDEIKKLDGDIK